MINIDYIKQSPHYSVRNDEIRKITIHHMAGNLTVEQCGDVFQSREASANYGIGSDGRIGMYVPEKYRAWSTSDPENDHQSINIELANDGAGPDWHVSDKAIEKCIELCVDICTRYGFKLDYTGTAKGNLTMHCWFIPTVCPGPYLKSKFKYIADEVNKRLGCNPSPEPVDEDEYYSIQIDAKFITYGSTGKWVKVWQDILGITSDGSFGPDTLQKTKNFQQLHDLEVDGLVGPKTWQKGFKVIRND